MAEGIHTMASTPLIDDSKVISTQAQPPGEQYAEPEGQAPAGESKAAQDELILGKFKNVDDLAKSYQELESFRGRQSSELGDLRKQNDLLAKNLELLQQNMQAPKGKEESKPAAPDWDQQLADIQRQVDSGEIDISQALRMTSEITTSRALSLAEQKYQQYDQQKQARSIQQKFMEEHPDFNTFLQSPERQALRQSNPLHDDFSAYWNWKAVQNEQSAKTAAEEAYNRGKSEIEKVAQGAQAAGRVMQTPGSGVRNANPPAKPMSDYDIKQSMAAALGKARGR
jgi:hypothetical protein